MIASELKFDQDLLNHLSGEDELGVVIRSHIYFEAVLREFIEKKIPNPNKLPKRMQYEQSLLLACALGLDEEYFEALKALGQIRNDFGHRVNTKLSDTTVNQLYEKLPEKAKQITEVAYARTTWKVASDKTPSFNERIAKERFILIAVVLHAFLLAKAHLAKRLA